MRLFTCLLLSPATRDAVLSLQSRLKPFGDTVRWSEPESLHLTVSFIGEIADPSLLPDVQSACDEIAQSTTPFRFRVAGASVFPKRGDIIKTVIATVTDGADDWKALVRRSEPWLSPFGAKPENGLAPHVTLGRAKGGETLPELRAAIEREKTTDCGTQDATRLVLVESVLTPTGAVYKERGAWAFTGL